MSEKVHPCVRCSGNGDHEAHPRELAIAGVDEHYRIVDGVMEIRSSIGPEWIRQKSPHWDKVESWRAEAAAARGRLHIALAIIALMEHPTCQPNAVSSRPPASAAEGR